MSQHISQDEFVSVCYECAFSLPDIISTLRDRYPDRRIRRYVIENRLRTYRSKGILPLDSGNTVSAGEKLRGSSTLYDADGNVRLQWVKSNVAAEDFLDAFQDVISELSQSIPALPVMSPPPQPLNDDLATLYISNDLHFGALIWDKETGSDYDTQIATDTVKAAYDHLFQHAPDSRIGIVVDLGDLMEIDNDKNMTPKSGNVLASDSRYPKILRAAYESLIYAVYKALEKHELVYFYNIAGNHDVNTASAIREVIRMTFINNPRVIVDESPALIKYHQHGKVLFQFAHGDGMKMKQAGEVMAADQHHIFSETSYRYSHMGHTHVDSVYDSRLCRAESHRNLAPNNHWAFSMGYRRQPGTMKAITYDASRGEVSRQLFTL